ncbi:hypothetical protein PR003_g9668 [Phytophthora rubi]|uniref:Uncharacterized protein n=1 Tax=Phytophthora rubi TaxID=129364 RepID=A0A6A4FDK9_9STRA|nr:hypothetical protein PR002_g9468 [Phytophthora rubi]KAE9342062.1 hypothetical protein PR003_g9668 [Phytophthora rubi]
MGHKLGLALVSLVGDVEVVRGGNAHRARAFARISATHSIALFPTRHRRSCCSCDLRRRPTRRRALRIILRVLLVLRSTAFRLSSASSSRRSWLKTELRGGR